MEISKETWNKYTKMQEHIRKTAAKKMADWIAENGINDRQAMIEFANALTTKYGEAAGAYACQLFDEIALNAGVNSVAVPAEVATIDEVGKAVNGSLKKSPSGKLVPQIVERLTKQAGADTMLQNTRKYSAEWAWIPDGGSCVFCMTLASRGWQHLSKSLQSNHAEHIHANCNCEFAIRFNPNDNVAGYDPKKYLDEYNKYGGNLKAWRSSLDDMTKKMREPQQTDITQEFLKKASPNIGKVVFDKNLTIDKHKNEIIIADWLKKTFGGDIRVLEETKDYSRKMPDYLWDNKLWDLKTTSTEKSANSAIRGGLKQIVSNPGGIILDYGNHEVQIADIEEVINKRMKSSLYSTKSGIDVIIKTKNEIKILRYKK